MVILLPHIPSRSQLLLNPRDPQTPARRVTLIVDQSVSLLRTFVSSPFNPVTFLFEKSFHSLIQIISSSAAYVPSFVFTGG
ncbi:hypothetical protein GYMLUDRAFT_245853 [Collybiopsis luxurians FD-317 M1]|uniref:Uncharacterized protein n=1 Tax=Collybiopsis luxurians FD-317 M1 TaxID=944289 RepID=A0A0D0C8D5_9AGAR|nr:hypothetical protein GYMLUDRAFT_245853 [Collybiopsis luxurians FD-317 M1]